MKYLLRMAWSIVKSYLLRVWYYIQNAKLKNEIEEAKKDADDKQAESDSSYTDFKFKLEQYRKSDGKLPGVIKDVRVEQSGVRSTTKPVCKRSRQTAGDDQSKEQTDKQTGGKD